MAPTATNKPAIKATITISGTGNGGSPSLAISVKYVKSAIINTFNSIVAMWGYRLGGADIL